MVYSSGTTCRPKGIRKPFVVREWNQPDPRNVDTARVSSVDAQAIFLSTSPLYHSALHRYLCAALHAGATIVLMDRFDAPLALDCIDRHGCTHSIWVPTMFTRLLKLDPLLRQAYRGHTHKWAVHGAASCAAPCPVHLKHAMIDWWEPILLEYYASTVGGCAAVAEASVMCARAASGEPAGWHGAYVVIA
jgi:long-chain acyl-CoA synthetase